MRIQLVAAEERNGTFDAFPPSMQRGMNMNSATSVSLNQSRQDLIASARDLAQCRFAPRASAYDRDATFPVEDFRDLYSAGLLKTVIPSEYGGFGLGPHRGNVLTLWLMTKEFAKADLSLARCWEGHCNSMALIDGIATDAQKERWFGGVVSSGETW